MLPAPLTFYKVHGHLQAVRVLVAIVENVRAQRNIRQQRAHSVDAVQCVQHHLERLNAALRHDRSARDRILARVHHHEAAEHDVALDNGRVLDGPSARSDGGRRNGRQQLTIAAAAGI